MPPMTTVHIHQTQDVHTEGNPLQMPFYVPNHKYGSSGLAHHDRTLTLGKACFYSICNTELVGAPWLKGNSNPTAKEQKIFIIILPTAKFNLIRIAKVKGRRTSPTNSETTTKSLIEKWLPSYTILIKLKRQLVVKFKPKVIKKNGKEIAVVTAI